MSTKTRVRRFPTFMRAPGTSFDRSTAYSESLLPSSSTPPPSMRRRASPVEEAALCSTRSRGMKAVSPSFREARGTSVTMSSASLRWTMRSNSVSAEEAAWGEWNWATISRARRFLRSRGLTEREARALGHFGDCRCQGGRLRVQGSWG